MAEEIFQKRTYELAEFEPLAEGEPGYTDPATIWMVVDNVTWPEPRKISLLQFIADLHKEQRVFTLDGTENGIVEPFNINFGTSNYYLKVDVYELINRNGDIIRNKIKIKNFNKAVNQFSFELEEYRAGMIVEYLGFE